MRAKLKELYSLDVDLDTYLPEDPENFGLSLRAIIGPENQDGGESFDFQLCTPAWLRTKYPKEQVLFGRHFLIVFEYDKKRIEQKISRYCERCVGENWQQIAEKLSRVGQWEFEDYQQS